MFHKRKQNTDLVDNPHKKFAKTVQNGTWLEFLMEDAHVTRKAFARWWNGVFLKSSPKADELSGKVKAQIQGLLTAKLPNPVGRGSLLPGTLEVIQEWESIHLLTPDVEKTPEWAKARIRLIRDLIIDGTFQIYQDHFDLKATSQEIGHARSWFYQRDDGKLGCYRSLAQPWCYKDIEFRNESFVTKLADPDLAAKTLPQAPDNANINLNRLRITDADFQKHLFSLRVPTAEQQQQQQSVQTQNVTESATTAAPSTQGEMISRSTSSKSMPERKVRKTSPGSSTLEKNMPEGVMSPHKSQANKS
ncbi:MAG: hypothetical protein Q9226_009273 [Calogaya cf. arnoldii]